MFLGLFTYTNYPIKDIDGLLYYEYRVDDDGFTEFIESPVNQPFHLPYPELRCGAVIECYEKRDPSSVAFNVALYHEWASRMYSRYPLDNEILYNYKYTPKYKDYYEDILYYIQCLDKVKIFS